MCLSVCQFLCAPVHDCNAQVKGRGRGGEGRGGWVGGGGGGQQGSTFSNSIRGRNSSLVVFGLAVHSVAGSILLWGNFSGRGDFFPWS